MELPDFIGKITWRVDCQLALHDRTISPRVPKQPLQNDYWAIAIQEKQGPVEENA
jgi:hypothetical protein